MFAWFVVPISRVWAGQIMRIWEYELGERNPRIIIWSLLLAQAAIFVSSPGSCKFFFPVWLAFWMIATNLVISSKQKRPAGLDQNKNFGQVALVFYLARRFRTCLSLVQNRLWNLRRHMDTTSRLEWNSSHAGELISVHIQNLQFLSTKVNQKEIWGCKKITITSTICRLGGECRGRAKLRLHITVEPPLPPLMSGLGGRSHEVVANGITAIWLTEKPIGIFFRWSLKKGGWLRKVVAQGREVPLHFPFDVKNRYPMDTCV